MTAGLLAEVTSLLDRLEATQEELLALFNRKLVALTAAQADEIVKLAESETKLSDRLKQHLAERQRILQQAKERGLACRSVVDVVNAIGGRDRDAIKRRANDSRRRSAKLRQESWIHWIIAHRAIRHHSELLNLIAHCGEKAPTYDKTTGTEPSAGGAILDTSA